MTSLHAGPLLRAALRQRWALVLVVAQVAIGLLISLRSAHVGQYVLTGLLASTGTDETGLLVVEVQERAGGDVGAAQAADLAQLRRLPGVLAVAWVDGDPLGPLLRAPDALATPGRNDVVGAISLGGGPGLAQALGLHLVAGRDLVAADGAAGEAVPAILPASLADELFAGDPIGRRFDSREVGTAVVVGVAEHLALKPTRGSIASTVIYARTPGLAPAWRFVVRATPGELGRLLTAIPAALQRRGEPPRWIGAAPADGYRRALVRAIRHSFLVVLGVIALILVVIAAGQLAVVAFLVQERTRQIGLRRALGARRRDVLAHFMLENLLVSGAGVALGLAMHFGLLASVRGHVAEIEQDPLIVLGCVAVMFLLGQVATFWPAYQAASIPPSVASKAA